MTLKLVPLAHIFFKLHNDRSQVQIELKTSEISQFLLKDAQCTFFALRRALRGYVVAEQPGKLCSSLLTPLQTPQFDIQSSQKIRKSLYASKYTN